MEEHTNDNVMLFSAYTTLYVNDIACNSANEIKEFSKNKDKETLKIYGALHKRVKYYFNHVKKVVNMDGLYFLSDFYQILDEYTDQTLPMLKKTVRGCLNKHGIDDDGMITNTIITYLLTGFACNTNKTICDNLKENNIPAAGLPNWNISEIERVAKNLCSWVCRKLSDSVLKEITNLTTPIITLLSSKISSYNNFERAYEYAIKEANRNEENKL